MAPPISGVSLGMIIVDEIRMPHKPPLVDVIGGSGSFVALGQRLFAKDAANVGCLVIAGKDFPKHVEEELENLGVTLVLKKRDALSTRGLLEYQDDTFGRKSFHANTNHLADKGAAKIFRYTGGPLKASVEDLLDTPLLCAKALHFFATPEEILDQVPQLLRFREACGNIGRPLIVWEPFPGACKTQNKRAFYEACKLVDVFSPNHLEMAAIFTEELKDEARPEKWETWGDELLTSGIGPRGEGSLVVRAGEHGSLTMNCSNRPAWLPAYYEKGSSNVVDPTGAGNSFLGGYMAGWQATGSINEAVSYGHVAASFALEQIGLPKLTKEGDKERWNGVDVYDRLKEYKARLKNREVKSECFV